MQNKSKQKYSLHHYCDNSPRYISNDVCIAIWDHLSKQRIQKKVDGALHIYRKLHLYTDLEKIQSYELSNAYAYEIALRTPTVKDGLRSIQEQSNTQLSSFTEKTWLDAKEVLLFENIRCNDKAQRQFNNVETLLAKRTLPEIRVPSDKTEYYPIHLNMFLPKNELKTLLEEYVHNIEKMKFKRKHLSETMHTLFGELKASSKLMRKKANVPQVQHSVMENIEKPNTMNLKFAETLFSYDMIELGFNPHDIAQAIERYRLQILIDLNHTLLKTKNVPLSDLKNMLAVVEAKKTALKWHKDIQNFITEDQYKYIISPKETNLLSTDGYL